MHETLDLYIYPTFDVVFLITAIITYVYIFHKYKQSRLPPTPLHRRSSMVECVKTFKVFKQSRFYIPLLLTLTFVVFMVIPEFVNLSRVASGRKSTEDVALTTCLKIMWTLSYLVDAVIYIWMKTSVRKLMKRKLQVRRKRKFQSQCTITTTFVMEDRETTL